MGAVLFIAVLPLKMQQKSTENGAPLFMWYRERKKQ
jgi:hypothetical protein